MGQNSLVRLADFTIQLDSLALYIGVIRDRVDSLVRHDDPERGEFHSQEGVFLPTSLYLQMQLANSEEHRGEYKRTY